MADWDGLRRDLEGAVTPPPLDALRARRRRRRQRRRTMATAFAIVLVGSAGGMTVLGRDAGRDQQPPVVAGPRPIDVVIRGDRLSPPVDFGDYVVTDVDFVTPGTGWAIGLRCQGETCDVATWRTADGGRSWAPRVAVASGIPRATMAEQDPAGGGARALRMVNEREGFAFNPDLYATHDGGRTWERVPQRSKVAGVHLAGPTAWVFTRGCPADDDCDAVLRSGRVGPGFRLTDLPLPPTKGAPAVVRRADADRGYIVSWDAPEGPRAAFRRTANGGRTWTDGANPCPDATAELISAGAGRPLWLVCTTTTDEQARTADKQVFQSGDHGTTWRRLGTPPAAGVVTDFVALSATTAYLTTQVPAQLLVTTDGGASWRPADGSARSGYGYGNLDVVDARHAWAMGDAGQLWRTTDGTNWERLALPPGGTRAAAPPLSVAPART